MYLFLLYMALAFSANAICQDVNDDDLDGEEPLTPATFRISVVDFTRPEWERELSMGTANVIIPDDFKGEQKKLPEYLDMVPGLHIERRGGEGQYSAVTMRGSTSAQVTIYVDGVPQNLGLDGAVDLSLIPMSNVARIEVYRGHVPARFSGAPIGGVINIVTKKPRGLGFNISAGAKSFSGKNADATITAPLFGGSLLLGFHRDQSKGDFGYEYTPPTLPAYREGAQVQQPYPSCGITLPCARTRKSNSYKDTDALIKWQDENLYSKFAWKETSRFYPNETNKKGSGLESRIDLDEELLGPYSLNTYHRYQKVDQYDLLLGRRQTWRDVEWGVEANYMKQEKLYDMMDFKWQPDRFQTAYIRYPGEIWNTYDTRRYGLSLDGSYKFGDRQLIEFRADFFDEKLMMDGNQARSLEGGGYSKDSVSGRQAEPVPVSYRRATWHVQASDTITLNENRDLLLTLTARWDKASDKTDLKNRWFTNDSNSNGTGTWGISLKKEIGDTWTFGGSGGAYVRYPSFYELYGDGVYVVPGFSSPDYDFPGRETGRQWDLGVDWRGKLFHAPSTLTATWFSRLTDRQIYPNYNPLNGTIQYMNVGVVEAHGAEFEGALHWSRFNLSASATWQKSNFVKAMTRGRILLKEDVPLTLMPEWETYVRGEYRPLRRLSLFAEHHYTGSMLENWIEEYNINHYGVTRRAMNVTGAGLRYKTSWGFNMVGGVDDIFNKRSSQKHDIFQLEQTYAAAFPSPGRTWYVTLDYGLGRGSAYDSSGTGSADPKPAAGNTPVLKTGNGVAARKRFFYIAPRLIYNNRKAEMASRGIELGPGNIGNIGESTYSYLCAECAGPQMPFPELGKRDSWMGGGLALGADLYERYDLPLRVEFEADIPVDATIEVIHPGWKKDGIDPQGLYVIGGESRPDNFGNISKYKFKYRSHNALFNLYYDYHNATRFTPYVGAGAGLSFVKTDGVGSFFSGRLRLTEPPQGWPYHTDSITVNVVWDEGVRARNFAWNASAGVSYRLTDDFNIDVAYRYLNTGFDGRNGLDHEAQIKQNEGIGIEGLYQAVLTIQAPALDLLRQHQAVVSLRFSF